MPRTKCYAKRIEVAEVRIEVAMKHMKAALEASLSVVAADTSRKSPDHILVVTSYGGLVSPPRIEFHLAMTMTPTNVEVSSPEIEACREQFKRVFGQHGMQAVPTVRLTFHNGKLTERTENWWARVSNGND